MGGEADGELEVRRGVRTHVKAGVDVIKIMATGGHMTLRHESESAAVLSGGAARGSGGSAPVKSPAHGARARSVGHRQRG